MKSGKQPKDNQKEKKFKSKAEIDATDQPKAPASVEVTEEEVEVADSKPQQIKKKRINWTRKKKIGLAVFIVFVALIIAAAIPSVYTYTVATDIQTTANSARTHATAAASAMKNQDLATAKAELDATRKDVETIQTHYDKLDFWYWSPFRAFHQDGQRILNSAVAGLDAADILVLAIEPYTDVLGLTGEVDPNAGAGTAEDRITTIIETIPLILPQLDEVQAKLTIIEENIDQIDPNRYPFSYGDQNVGDLITRGKTGLHQANQALTDYRPLIEQLPEVAGANEKKTYLVIFQNDGELRPTGGFITAYALLDVENGKVAPVKSDDIYTLDNKFNERIDAPQPILDYLDNVYYWNLRDMNLSPDFKESMDTFSGYYVTVPGEPDEIDGIIAVNTQVLSHLIEVLGPIEVGGYGVFTAETEERCNCPQVVYSLENMITRPTPYHRSDRKGVLGPLMQSILRKAYDAPSEVNPILFQTVLNDINQKHILFYFTDEASQIAAEKINVAGRIHDYDGDYLHINDANLGGAKSNIFITQEVEQDIELVDSQVKKTVTVVYKNPARASNCNLEAGQLCLNGVLKDWIRFYVPEGSQLIESSGFDDDTVKEDQDLGKHVIEGAFTLTPESQTTLKVVYSVPYNPQGEYKLLLQKQPGSKNTLSVVKLDGRREEFPLESDKELILPL